MPPADPDTIPSREDLLKEVLKHGRVSRGLSQLGLALSLGVSQRHVSFVEVGRARPSRDLIRNWMQEVEAPSSVRNAALVLGGYQVDDQALSASSTLSETGAQALSRMLDLHSPFPGFTFNADWRITEMNSPGQWLCSVIVPEVVEQARLDGNAGALDMIDTLAHPNGFLARMQNPTVAGYALLEQLKGEAWTRPQLRARIDRYEASLTERYGSLPDIGTRAAGEPYLNLVFDTDLGPLSFVTIQSVFGVPQNVTVAALRIELWFPADQYTLALLRDHCSGRSETDTPRLGRLAF